MNLQSKQLTASPCAALTLVITSLCLSALVQAEPLTTRPDALLQIDSNRAAVVTRIVEGWKTEIPAAQMDALRNKLMRLRADQLLAANVSGSFDGVLEIVAAHEKSQFSLKAAHTALPVQAENVGAEHSKAIGNTAKDLVYTPVEPCRFFDTRQTASPTKIAAGTSRDFDVIASSFAPQGGVASTCGIDPAAVAVAINYVATAQNGAGYAVIYAAGTPLPPASSINFPLVTVQSAEANFGIFPICTAACPAGKEITVFVNETTHFLADVVGYFLPVSRGNIINTFDGGNVFEVTNNATTSFSTAIKGASSSTNNKGIGVWGSHAGGGFGVFGTASTGGYGVYGSNTDTATGYAVYAGGNLAVEAKLKFGTSARQMIDLWGSTGQYGIGVQSGTQYFRTDSNATSGTTGGFAWYEGGVHSNTEFDAGAGGSSLLRLTRAKELVFGDPSAVQNGEFLKLNVINTRTIGSQGSTLYFRTNNQFCWHRDGVHSDSACDPGVGGTTLMSLTGSGLTVRGTFVSASDRNVKEQFAAINPKEMLKRVVAMPISSWVYKADNKTRHIGPVAQDFKRLFGVGQDDKTISMVDADGVAFAAIQGLSQIVKERDAEIAKLKADLGLIKKKLGL
jgi:hypothetical protein